MHYLVGGGISSLAAAVFLVRDASVPGEKIKIFKQSDRLGGSLDASGGPADGYLVRGGRMFEEHFVCTFDLLDTIPSPGDPVQSIKNEIFAFNRAVPGSSNCRLVRGGKRSDVSLGLSPRDIQCLGRLIVQTEWMLEGRTIGSCFTRAFFDSNFWLMWSTMFAFQPWHSAIEMRRYLRRFIHLFPGLSRIEGVLRTRYNQYDSIIAPIVDWLSVRNVQFDMETRVNDVEIIEIGEVWRVTKLMLDENDTISVLPSDRVYLTLGSMTDASTEGSNSIPPSQPKLPGDTWTLWRKLSEQHPDFGNPNAFCSHTDKTTWMSFTVTMQSAAFF
jgi:oleate hydratase